MIFKSDGASDGGVVRVSDLQGKSHPLDEPQPFAIWPHDRLHFHIIQHGSKLAPYSQALDLIVTN